MTTSVHVLFPPAQNPNTIRLPDFSENLTFTPPPHFWLTHEKVMDNSIEEGKSPLSIWQSTTMCILYNANEAENRQQILYSLPLYFPFN